MTSGWGDVIMWTEMVSLIKPEIVKHKHHVTGRRRVSSLAATLFLPVSSPSAVPATQLLFTSKTSLTTFQWQISDHHGNWCLAIPVSRISKTKSSYASLPIFSHPPSLSIQLYCKIQAADNSSSSDCIAKPLRTSNSTKVIALLLIPTHR